MFDAKVYARNNEPQRGASNRIIADYLHYFKWRPDGKDSLLDIGCGTGDITIDYILPILPPTVSRLLGADVSEGMLRAARQTAANFPQVCFEQLDVGKPLDANVWPTASFDHITSFFCLHWVQDQRQALQNIYKLLTPGGDCLLVYVHSNRSFEAFTHLAKMPRWAPLLRDLEKFMPVFQNTPNATAVLEQLLHEVGFTTFDVQTREDIFEFDGVDEYKCIYKQLFNLNIIFLIFVL